MFSTVYQNGEYGIEIFSPSGNEPFKLCKLSNEINIKKVYDRSIKGYMASLEKESPTTSLQIPKSSKTSLGITQPILVLQVQLHPEKSFSMELNLLDTDRQKRRFHLSTNFKEVDSNNLHVCIPWNQVDREQWTNVAINLVELIASFSPPGSNVDYFGLESFVIQPVCHLRKIFTLPMKYLGDEDTGLLIPPKYDFTSGVEANSWVLSYTLPIAGVKGLVTKDQDVGHKAGKTTTRTAEGAKEGNLMGIVGKKVPRQDTAGNKLSAHAAPKSEAGATTEESSAKRQKAGAATTAAAAVSAGPSNPWAVPAAVAVTAAALVAAVHPSELTAVERVAEKTEKKPQTVEHTSVPMKKSEPIESQPVQVEAMEVVEEEASSAPVSAVVAPPVPVTPAAPATAAIPAGGIKFSGKLKQKLSSSSPAVVAAAPAPAVSAVLEEGSQHLLAVNEDKSPAQEKKEEAMPPSKMLLPTPTPDPHHNEDLSVPPASLPSRPLFARGSMNEDNLFLASQDFSAIDDFVKNYSAQQGSLQGYSSYARVDAEVAAQLNHKGKDDKDKTNSADTKSPDHLQQQQRVADANAEPASGGFKDFLQQVKERERTPSRVKKFVDVALSPMPKMLPPEPASVVKPSHVAMSPVIEHHGCAEGLDDDDPEPEANAEPEADAGADHVTELVKTLQSRPSTARAASPTHSRGQSQSRPPTAEPSSRPSTAGAYSKEDVIAAHTRLPTPPPTPQLPSRPTTARAAIDSDGDGAAASVSTMLLESPSQRQTPARSLSRPPTASTAARLSSAAVESALLSPFSDAMAYFEKGTRSSRDASAQSAQSAQSALADISAEQQGPVPMEVEDETIQVIEPEVSLDAPIGEEGGQEEEPQSYFEVYQERSSGIAHRWVGDIDSLLDQLSSSSSSSQSAAAAVGEGTNTVTAAAANIASPDNTTTAALLSPGNLTTPLPERKKRAIRTRVANLLRQVEQAEMEYIAEFGFEAFEAEVGFFEEKVRSRRS